MGPPCWVLACSDATETLELSVGFGELGSALASCVRPKPIPAVVRTAAPPMTNFFIVGSLSWPAPPATSINGLEAGCQETVVNLRVPWEMV